jgi:uncharacterized protein (TIGR02186 family)
VSPAHAIGLALAALVLSAPAAHAQAPEPSTPIAAGLAEDTVEVKVNYSGARIVLFVASPDGESEETGFAVALIGPSAPHAVVRQTAQGEESFRFVSAPIVFAVGAEPLVAETVTIGGMGRAGLNAAAAAMPPAEGLDSPELPAWRAALVELKMDQNLYSLDETTIDRLPGGLRRARINLPINAPPGEYTVRAVVFRDGEPVGETEQTLTLVRGGMDATLYDLSRRHGLIYGFLAILLGSAVGGIAAWLGRR